MHCLALAKARPRPFHHARRALAMDDDTHLAIDITFARWLLPPVTMAVAYTVESTIKPHWEVMNEKTVMSRL